MMQMPESQYGSARMRPSQIQIESDEPQASTRRRNFLSPTFSQNLPLFRELQARSLQQRQEPDQSNSVLTLNEEKSISCHAQMVKSLLFNLFLQTFFITFYAYMHWKFSHRYVLLQLWIQDLVTIFILIYYNYRKGDDCIWQLIETMFLFFFKIFIVFYYEVQEFKIYFISIMMLGVSSLLLLIKLINKLKNPQKASSELILQLMKTIFCLQILLITLKWENKLSWSWFQVFLLLWVFLVVCSLLLLIAFFSCVETIFKIAQKKQQCHYLAGNLWIFIMLMGFTLFPFLFLMKASNYYESSNQQISLDETAQYIIIMVLFSLILIVYSLCFYKQIKLYLKDVQGVTEEREDNTINSPIQREQNKKIEFVRLGIPLYLIKLSCTYFAVLDKAAFDFRKQKKKIQTNNVSKEIELGRSAGQSSTMRETFKKILQKPMSSNSLIENRKNDVIDMDLQKPAITDNSIKLLLILVIKLKQEVAIEIQESSENNHNDNSKSLKSDVESSMNNEKCLVCYENIPNIVFIPCRHGGICQQCAEDIIHKSNECYLCRRPIQQILKVQKNDAKQLEVQEASLIN